MGDAGLTVTGVSALLHRTKSLVSLIHTLTRVLKGFASADQVGVVVSQ